MKEMFGDIRRFTLNNGLTVLLESNTDLEEVSVHFGVRSGQLDDPPDMVGGHHFIEHLLFKSNPSNTNEEIVKRLEWGGVEVSAHTDYRATWFSAEGPPEQLTLILDIVHSMFANQQYREKEFLSEKNVILDEVAGALDSPSDYTEDLFFATLFAGSVASGSTFEAERRCVDRMTLSDVLRLQQTFFVANDMVLVIAGNFADSAAFRDRIAAIFAPLPAGVTPPKLPVFSHANARRTQLSPLRPGIQSGYLSLGYVVPDPLATGDMPALRILRSILTDGMSSRLFLALRESEIGSGYEIDSELTNLGPIGYLRFDVFQFSPHKFEEIVTKMQHVFEDVKRNPIPEEELHGKRTWILSKFRKEILNDALRFGELRFDQEVYQSPYDPFRTPEYFGSVRPGDILRVANAYLTEDFTLTALLPR